MRCMCHRLQTIQKDAFHESEDEHGVVPKIILFSKALVAFCKDSDIQSILSSTLKQVVATRWDSILNCLNSLLKNRAEIAKLIENKFQSSKRTKDRSRGDLNIARCDYLFQGSNLDVLQALAGIYQTQRTLDHAKIMLEYNYKKLENIAGKRRSSHDKNI